jgi:hypothetical protein
MNTLTFNASNWVDDEVTAAVNYLGCGEHCIVFRDTQFESLEYTTGAFSGVDEYRVAELKHEGQLVATAYQDGRHWYAVEADGDIEREDENPLIALLQIAANTF